MALRLRGFYGLKNKRLTGIDPRTWKVLSYKKRTDRNCKKPWN